MRIKLFVAIAALFMGSFFVAGCGSSNGEGSSATTEVSNKDTPTDAAVKVLDLFKEKKYYDALLLCKDADQEPEDKLKGVAELLSALYESAGGLADYEILGETINEDGMSAVVDVNFKYGNAKDKKD